MLQEPIKIQNSHKGTTLDIKMNKSTVHKLIGSNKLAANKRKRFMDLITTLLAFPEMVLTQKYNKLLFFVYQIVVTMTKMSNV